MANQTPGEGNQVPKRGAFFLPHSAGVAGAIVIALLLIVGALWGANTNLSFFGITGIEQSLRNVSVAAWALLIPAWFTFEEMMWAPPSDQPQAVDAFRRGQQAGRFVITLVGALIFAVVLGVSPNPAAPPGPSSGAPPSTTNAHSN